MSTVIDASVVVAAVLDSGPDGRWAEDVLANGSLVGPHLLPVEFTNIIRRAAARGRVSVDVAAIAQHDAVDLAVTLFPFRPLAGRVWQLRAHVTGYDAWYMALVEDLGAPLATMDRRLTRAAGPRSDLLTPP